MVATEDRKVGPVGSKDGKSNDGKSKPAKRPWGTDKSPPHLRFRDFVLTLLLTLVMGYGIGFLSTKSLTWPLELKVYKQARWAVVKRLRQSQVVTEEELAGMTGEDGGPVWLGIMKEVYDVSDGRKHYGKDGSYSSFAGRDSSRAYATGCFDGAHLTHDLRDLDRKTIKKAEDWADFYRYHDVYSFVGFLKPEPPTGEVPGKCDYKTHKPVSPKEVLKMKKLKKEGKAEDQVVDEVIGDKEMPNNESHKNAKADKKDKKDKKAKK